MVKLFSDPIPFEHRALPQTDIKFRPNVFVSEHEPTFTIDRANTQTTVLACRRVIAQTMASFSLHVHQQTNAGSTKATDSPAYKLFHRSPNPFQTKYSFLELACYDAIDTGDFFAEIEIDNAGRILALHRLDPSQVGIERIGNEKRFTYVQPDRSVVTIPQWRVFHWYPFAAKNGIRGNSLIRAGASVIGAAVAEDTYIKRFYENGAFINRILYLPNTPKDEVLNSLKAQFAASYSGVGNSGKTAFLPVGYELKEIGLNPKDLALLETRQLSSREICKLFGVPPSIIGDTEKSSFSTVEMQNLQFFQFALMPFIVSFEEAVNQQLFDGSDLYLKFNVDTLLRSDNKSKMESLAIGWQNGFYQKNEIRSLLDLNEVEGGDVFAQPLNTALLKGDALNQPVQLVPVSDAGSPSARRSFEQPTEQRVNGVPVEVRERHIRSRHKIARNFKPVYKDAIARIVRREANDIKKLLQKHVAQRDATTLQAAIEEFYRQHEDFIKRNIKPSVEALAQAVLEDVQEELGRDLSGAEWTTFVEDYITGYASAHNRRSLGQLTAELTRAIDEQLPIEETIQTRLDEWEERRPEKDANNETTRTANAALITLFAVAGITRLVWQNSGESNCPICKAMHGRTVGITENFSNPGEKLPLGFTTNRQVKAPPLHGGCDCTVTHG